MHSNTVELPGDALSGAATWHLSPAGTQHSQGCRVMQVNGTRWLQDRRGLCPLLQAVPGDASGVGPGMVPWHSRSLCPTGGDPGVTEGSGPLRRQLPADTGAGRHLPLLPRRVGSILPGVCYHTICHRLTSPRCPSIPTTASVSHGHPQKSDRKAQERGRKRRALLLLPVTAHPPPRSLPPRL